MRAVVDTRGARTNGDPTALWVRIHDLLTYYFRGLCKLEAADRPISREFSSGPSATTGLSNRARPGI
jgi:hypothetical protein